jgi:general stress protein YciG
MPGTIKGGKSAGDTNKARYGEDYYRRIGAIGGKKSRRTVEIDSEWAKLIGQLGGRPPKSGRYSMARRQRMNQARAALQKLRKERGMI